MVNLTMLVRNRPRLTAQALDSLGTHEGCTVTVILDRADHEVSGIVNDFAEGAIHRTAIYNDKPSGTGVLRNYVVETSESVFGRGDYLYLSDNDVYFKPRWLETLIGSYEIAWLNGFKVLGAYNHPYHQPSTSGAFYYEYDIKEVNALALQSMLMRWEVWDKYGPFCETPVDKVCQSEDVDFTNKIHADGFKIGVVSPALVVNTGITNSFGEKIPGWELVQAQCPAGVLCE